MAKRYITWLHLSDLHMEQEDRFNRRVVIEALWRDIESLIKRGLPPDFIVFTGDIAYHGTTEEYDLAIKEFFDPLLSITGLSKDRLFIVPGNHDVNRTRTSRLLNPVPNLGTEDDIRKLLENADEKELLLAPFASYAAFIRTYLESKSACLDPSFACHYAIDYDGFSVSIVGINSAWLCGFNRDREGKINDFGQLAVSELQVREFLEPKADLRILLMHHPFEWLLQADRVVVEDLITSAYSMLLRGHIHRPDYLSLSSLTGDIIILPAGSVFDHRNSPNAYNLVQIDLASGLGTIYLRRYNNRRTEWQKDIESTGEERDGVRSFRVPQMGRSLELEQPGLSQDTTLEGYEIILTEDCRRDLLQLGLTQNELVAQVQEEFTHHVNYFRFDLDDYPLPVRANYIVYLSKSQNHLDFMRVVPCTRNEAKLSSWNDLLALYRKASRMSYREQPHNLLIAKGLVDRTLALHFEIRARLTKHFRDFYDADVNSEISGGTTETKPPDKSELASVPAESPELSELINEVSFRLTESRNACDEARKLVFDMDLGDITKENTLPLLVSALERSLQHIHKIILRYSPRA